MENRKVVNILTGEVSTLYRLGRQHLRNQGINMVDKKVLKQIGLNIVRDSKDWILRDKTQK